MAKPKSVSLSTASFSVDVYSRFSGWARRRGHRSGVGRQVGAESQGDLQPDLLPCPRQCRSSQTHLVKKIRPWPPRTQAKYGEEQGGWEVAPPFAEGKLRQAFSQGCESPSAVESQGQELLSLCCDEMPKRGSGVGAGCSWASNAQHVLYAGRRSPQGSPS